MKKIIVCLGLICAATCFAASAPAPRVLTLTGTPHPKAEVQRVDAATGTLIFRWLDSNGNAVDSGGSIATFTPVAPVAPVPPSTTPTYPEPSDATLKAAIENPPAPPTPAPHRVLKDTIILRVKSAGKLSDLATLIGTLSAADQFEFTHSTWFHSDNTQLIGAATALGLDPAAILAPDPLAP